MTSAEYDVVVVGSGFGGAVMACRLAEAGRSVAVLERGRRWDNADFPRAIGQVATEAFWEEGRSHGFIEYAAFRKLDVVLGAGVGGGSLHYFNVNLRARRAHLCRSAYGLGPSPAMPWNPITSGPWVCWNRSRCGRRMDGTLCPSVRACSSQPAGLPVMPQTRSRSPSTWTCRVRTRPPVWSKIRASTAAIALWLRRSGQEHTGLQLPGSGRAAPRRLHSAARGG